MPSLIEIHQWQTIDGEKRFSPKPARWLSGIRCRSTFIKHCKYLGLSKKNSFSYSEILEIRLIHRWLQSDSGCKHSRSKYLKLKHQPALLQLDFKQRGINPNQELQRIIQQSHRIR